MIIEENLHHQPIHNTHLVEGVLYIPQRNGNIQAYDINDKKFIWNHRSKTYTPKDKVDVSMSAIAVYGDFLYLSKHWGNLYLVDKITGIIKADPGVPYESRIQVPALQWGDDILFTNVAGEVFCVDSTTLKIKWQKILDAGYILSWVTYDDKIIFTTTNKEVICKDIKTFATNWSNTTKDYSFQGLGIFDNSLILNAGSVYSFDILTGKENWSVSKQGHSFQRQFELISNEIFCSSNDGLILQINAKTGESKELADLNEPTWFSPSCSKRVLVVTTTDKNIYSFEIK